MPKTTFKHGTEQKTVNYFKLLKRLKLNQKRLLCICCLNTSIQAHFTFNNSNHGLTTELNRHTLSKTVFWSNFSSINTRIKKMSNNVSFKFTWNVYIAHSCPSVIHLTLTIGGLFHDPSKPKLHWEHEVQTLAPSFPRVVAASTVSLHIWKIWLFLLLNVLIDNDDSFNVYVFLLTFNGQLKEDSEKNIN